MHICFSWSISLTAKWWGRSLIIADNCRCMEINKSFCLFNVYIYVATVSVVTVAESIHWYLMEQAFESDRTEQETCSECRMATILLFLQFFSVKRNCQFRLVLPVEAESIDPMKLLSFQLIRMSNVWVRFTQLMAENKENYKFGSLSWINQVLVSYEGVDYCNC